MKRVLAFILTAFLLFGAIPATFLNAFAVGPGVSSNGITNQSINDAANQYIPESVVIDGNVNNDTAWASHKWNEVNTNNGLWDSESPAESSKSLTYKYQLHYDYEYFYGAFVVDVLDCEVTVWLKDGTNAQGGYSHKLVYTVVNGAVTEESFLDYAGKGPKTPSLAVQQDIKAVKKDGNSTIIEFRRYLNAFTDPKKASDMQYFVSVKVGEDSLYFPKIKPEGELGYVGPSANTWPVAVDGSNHLTHKANSDKVSPVVVDGKFDEAMWAGLTNFYVNGEDDIANCGDQGTISFDTVKTHGYQDNDTNIDNYIAISGANAALGQTTGLAYNNGTLSVNDGDEDISTNGTTEGVKFKYDYRIDGEYFYIAVVAEVPKIAWDKVTVGANDMNSSGKFEEYVVKAEPNFTIQFYNHTNKYYNNDANRTQMSTNRYDGWAVEHLISFESYKLADNAKYSGAFSNICSRVTENNGKISNVNWFIPNNDDTVGQDVSNAATGYQGAGSYQGEFNGFGVWNFECRIKIDSVLSSKNLANNAERIKNGQQPVIEDLGFNVVVHDRRWLYENNNFGKVTDSNGKTYTLQYAYKAGDKWYYTNHYNRNGAWSGTNSDQYSCENHQSLNGAYGTGKAISGIVIDGNLDKRNNTALAGADWHIDSTFRDVGYENDKMQFAYIMNADYEYLYGAVVVTDYADLGGSFRVWTKADHTTNTWENAFDFSIDKSTGEVKFYSWWTKATGNNIVASKNSSKTWYRDIDSVDVDVAWEKLSNGDVRFEFRIALSEMGCTPKLNLDPTNNTKLLSYYVSLEAGGNNAGLVHPRCTSIPTSTWDTEHEGRIFYDTPTSSLAGRSFDHNDSIILDYIKIDGQLDEEIWDEASDRISVQGNNGAWQSTPLKNDVFEYSYVIYTADNYIYGAVELDADAIKASSTNGNKYTSIQLWLANPGSYDEWGVYANKNKYDNYYYNIYLCTDDFANAHIALDGPSGLMYGGSTPSVDIEYFNWGITTANGKTYAEFMISTDSYHYGTETNHRFSMNKEAGAEYFISVKHPTATGETLTLTYPKSAEMFYLTHYEDIHSEGAGNIYTNLINTDAKTNEYLDANGRWWTHAMLVPDTATGAWKVVAVKNGNRTLSAEEKAKQKASDGSKYESHYGFLPSEINANPGCIIYCVNTGNNYIQVMEDLKKNFEKTAMERYGTTTLDDATRAALMEELCANGGGITQYYNNEVKAGLHYNYVSSLADLMSSTMRNTWFPGDIIRINGIDSRNSDVATQVKALIQSQTDAQYEAELIRYDPKGPTSTSFVDPTKDPIVEAVRYSTVDKPYYFESGFRNIITYDRLNENTRYDDNTPDVNTWYTDNYGKLEKNEMSAPEKITVDGVLNDSGWAEDGWKTIDTGINATVQIGTAEKFNIKYQLRNDGKYLYVAAVFEGVKYDSKNAPVFTLWTKDKATDTNWSKYFRVGYNSGKTWAMNPEIPAIVDPDNRYTTENTKYTNYKVSEKGAKSVSYNNYIDAVVNNNPSVSNPVNGASLDYKDSAFYGYTETLENYVKDYWYPDIDIEILEYYFGKEAAVMKNDYNASIPGLGNYKDTSTVLEFRVALDEIDTDGDGFDYFISATRYGNGKEYTMYYPNVYCAPESEFSYYNLNLPFWKWYENTSAKVTAEDLYGDMYLCNEYAPVVTLGAKFNDNFDGNGSDAIRFGGYYSENMLRRQEGLLEGEYDQTCDYWHVQDIGVIFQFTQLLSMDANHEVNLTLDTKNVGKGSSVGIVNWVQDTNFADYESYAFYVTLNGVPENYKNVKFTARTYVQYYDFARVSDYYGQTIERSINMISENAQSSENVNLPK